jgi:hypothetical protein
MKNQSDQKILGDKITTSASRYPTGKTVIVVDRAGTAKLAPAYQPPTSLADMFSATFGR